MFHTKQKEEFYHVKQNLYFSAFSQNTHILQGNFIKDILKGHYKGRPL